MPRHPALLFVAALAAVVVGTPLKAQTFGSLSTEFDLAPSGSVATTAVSGDAGRAEVLRGPAGSVLVSVEVLESSDDPCRLVATFATWWVDPAVRDYLRNERPSGTCRARSPQAATLRQGLVTTGLRICQRQQNDRLKGVSLRAAAPTSGGLSAQAGATFERTNCNEWQQWVECPAGQAATGLIVHRDGSTIQGLGLECRAVALDPRAPARTTGRLGGSAPVMRYGSITAQSSLSGTSGTVQALSSSIPGATLRAISFGERSDRPCFLVAHFQAADLSQAPAATFDRCGGTRRGLERVEIPEGGSQVHVASGVRVCQRQTNDRLKGIRLEGSRVDGSGATHDSAIHDTAERTNCNDWRPMAYCPQTTVAVGVRVHYVDAIPAEIVGLSLDCRAVTYGND